MLELNQVYQGDCLEIMKDIDENSIDLTITSPPYDSLRNYNNKLQWSEEVWKKIIEKLYKVTNEGGVVVWIVNDETINGSETGTSFKQALYFKEIGFNLHDTMIYEKDNPPPVGGKNRYYQSFEYMFVFSKGQPKTFNPIKRERHNKWKDKRTKRVKAFTRNKDGNFIKKETSLTGNVKIGNIWKYVVGGGNSVPYGIENPAAFPEKLVRDHIISWSNEKDLILDPMAGSGTTGVAAQNLNRNYILIEKEPEYVETCKKRLKETKNKLNKIID